MSNFTIGSTVYTARKVTIGGNKTEYVFTTPNLPAIYSPRVTITASTNKNRTAAIVQMDVLIPSPQKSPSGAFVPTKNVLRKHLKVYLPMAVENAELEKLLSIDEKIFGIEPIANILKTGLLVG